MWFREEEVSTGRHSTRKQTNRRRGGSLLMVNRTKTPTRTLAMAVVFYVLVFVAGIAVLAAGWVGLRMAAQSLFSQNPRFAIRHINMTGGAISADLIREYAQIGEGVNLFAINIERIREDFLKQAPNIKSMIISRHLPDSLSIELVERDPLARMGPHGQLVVDRDGFLFGQGNGLRRLPIVTGYDETDLQPGKRVGGMMFAALELLELCDNPRAGIGIETLDISDPDYLDALVTCNGQRMSVSLCWEDMGKRSQASRAALGVKLGRIVSVMQTPAGQRASRLDATFEDQVVAR